MDIIDVGKVRMRKRMDRRQQKTRQAITQAFAKLMQEKNYDSITIADIIDSANIGRSTFYAHFETKEQLLKLFSGELFQELLEEETKEASHLSIEELFDKVVRGLDFEAYQKANPYNFQSMERRFMLVNLLSGENADMVLRYLKDTIKENIKEDCEKGIIKDSSKKIPTDFLIQQISSTFAESLVWWIRNERKTSSKELTSYFKSMINSFV